MEEYGSEDDLADSLSPGSPVKSMGHHQGAKKAARGGGDDFLGMKDYMDIMDRELASTTIGESFEKQVSSPRVTKATQTSIKL